MSYVTLLVSLPLQEGISLPLTDKSTVGVVSTFVFNDGY